MVLLSVFTVHAEAHICTHNIITKSYSIFKCYSTFFSIFGFLFKKVRKRRSNLSFALFYINMYKVSFVPTILKSGKVVKKLKKWKKFCKNDAERSKEVFKDYCPDWTDENFAEAEVLVSGIEYATLMTTDSGVCVREHSVQEGRHLHLHRERSDRRAAVRHL